MGGTANPLLCWMKLKLSFCESGEIGDLIMKHEYIINSSKTYVTYFPEEVKFNPKKIVTNLEAAYNKPTRAFWGSPVDTEFGWKELCENEIFLKYDFDKPIKWRLKDGSKILLIDYDIVTKPPMFLTDHMFKMAERVVAWETLTENDIKRILLPYRK